MTLLREVAERADAEEEPRYGRIAELARALADELAALPPDPELERARNRNAILGAIHDAHQPLREVVLYERARDRGLALGPREFQALAEELVTRGDIRVAVDHDGTGRDPEPFEPRFYRPVE